MKICVFAIILMALAQTAFAQVNPAERKSPAAVRGLFGALLNDMDLQKELKMTDAQVKRMREIYLQYTDPASVLFSPWGINTLDISKDQIQKYQQMQMENNNAKYGVLTDKTGKYTDIEKLKIVDQMDKAIRYKCVTVLTREQTEKYERMKGKPYKLNKPDAGPSKKKSSAKPDV